MNLKPLPLIAIIIAVIVITFLSTRNPEPKSQSDKVLTNSELLNTDDGLDITTKDVAYFENVKGYYARPEAQGKYPGIVMIHESWGLNDNIREMADSLAKEGYQVLAVDLYKGTVAKNQDEAVAKTSSLNQVDALNNLKAAAKFLRNNDSEKVATIGWGFGAEQAMQFSLSGEKLDGTIIYYGNPETDKTKLASIKWPVLGIFGDKDPYISVEKIMAFQKVLEELDIDHDITVYPSVGNAFANPTGTNYAAEETKSAWQKTLKFLDENL